MSIIKEKILFSKTPLEVDRGDGRFIYRVLNLLQDELKETGDRDWIIDGVDEASIRISHVKGRSTKVASGLKKLGFQEGDILHTAYSTCLDFYWPIFGAWMCGGVASCADPNLTVENIRSQIQDSRAKVVVCDADSSARYVEANQSLPASDQVEHILVLDKEPWEDVVPGASSFRKLFHDDGESCPDESSLSPYDPREPALINWTSGTTGKPKGVVHSQEYMHLNLRKSKLPQGIPCLTTSILFHGGGILLPLDGGVFNRFQVYFIKPVDFSPKEVGKCVEKYKPAFYMCGAFEFTKIANDETMEEDMSSLSVIMPSGARVTSTAVQRMKMKCPKLKFTFQFYGSTEVGGVSSSLSVDVLGGVREGVQVYIRDQRTGEKLGPGEVGELMAKTPTRMLKYLKREEETRDFFDKDGFAHMGDLGYYDEDGVLFYRERMKDLLKVGNTWIGPGEIEDRIESIPGVEEAVVWQTEVDRTGIYKTQAAVVLQPSAAFLPEDIRTRVNEDAPAHLHIDGDVVFASSLPHNPQGKKLRLEVRKIYSKT